MLGLITAITNLIGVLSDILEQITVIAVNTTPADDTTPADAETTPEGTT